MELYQRAPQPFYEGKANRLYDVEGHPDLIIIEHKNDTTAKDGEVKESIEGKGSYTGRISAQLFRQLNRNDIPTHFVQELSETETLVKRAKQVQLEVIVRNIATGSFCKRFPIPNGTEFKEPVVELNYKDDALHDPVVSEQIAIILGAAKDYEELDRIHELALSVNTVLWNFFQKAGIILVDFKLEFGRLPNGKIVVSDEISPDTCRFWDAETGESLDKDVFRRGEGNNATLQAYRELFERVSGED